MKISYNYTPIKLYKKSNRRSLKKSNRKSLKKSNRRSLKKSNRRSLKKSNRKSLKKLNKILYGGGSDLNCDCICHQSTQYHEYDHECRCNCNEKKPTQQPQQPLQPLQPPQSHPIRIDIEYLSNDLSHKYDFSPLIIKNGDNGLMDCWINSVIYAFVAHNELINYIIKSISLDVFSDYPLYFKQLLNIMFRLHKQELKWSTDTYSSIRDLIHKIDSDFNVQRGQ